MCAQKSISSIGQSRLFFLCSCILVSIFSFILFSFFLHELHDKQTTQEFVSGSQNDARKFIVRKLARSVPSGKIYWMNWQTEYTMFVCLDHSHWSWCLSVFVCLCLCVCERVCRRSQIKFMLHIYDDAMYIHLDFS